MNQIVRYAHEYRKAVGHLVIINLSDKKLSLPVEGQEVVPRILTQGVTVFMIVVDGKPRPSASVERKVETMVVTREQLLTEVRE